MKPEAFVELNQVGVKSFYNNAPWRRWQGLSIFDVVEPGKDLLLFDRGYPSLGLMFEMQAKGVDYLIRMREDWWLEVRKMVAGGVKDKEATFTLPANEKELLKKYNTTDNAIKCRLVCVQLPH